MRTRATLLLLCSALPSGAGLAASDVAERVEIALTADRDTYQVGEPVILELAVKNTGDAPVHGYMAIQPYLPEGIKTGVLLYCRGPVQCTEFQGKIPGVDKMNMAMVPTRLDPGRTQRSTFVIAVNPANQRFVLDEPGDVEIIWTTWGIHTHDRVTTRTRGAELRSSTRVHVVAVPPTDNDAYAFYSKEQLGQVAQYDPEYMATTEAQRLAARALLVRHPGSAYAQAVRGGLLKVLELRALRGKASAEEQELLGELRHDQPQP